ncbi:MAG: hypothetical protein OZ929_14660 [Bryobacterales bacterium]|nr:hypothetical protein [Bryobacterales bacterium]
MASRLSISFLTVLLLGAVVWGQCANCPPLPQQTSKAHDCCGKKSKPAHCGGGEQRDSANCATHLDAFQTYDRTDVKPVGVAGGTPDLPVCIPFELKPDESATGPDINPAYSPPERFVLNSTFLI